MTCATVECRRCGYVWEYSGLDLLTTYCPKCSARNQLQDHALDVKRAFGFSRSADSGTVKRVFETTDEEQPPERIQSTTSLNPSPMIDATGD
jgi:phage FluMu protein Com